MSLYERVVLHEAVGSREWPKARQSYSKIKKVIAKHGGRIISGEAGTLPIYAEVPGDMLDVGSDLASIGFDFEEAKRASKEHPWRFWIILNDSNTSRLVPKEWVSGASGSPGLYLDHPLGARGGVLTIYGPIVDNELANALDIWGAGKSGRVAQVPNDIHGNTYSKSDIDHIKSADGLKDLGIKALKIRHPKDFPYDKSRFSNKAAFIRQVNKTAIDYRRHGIS